MGHRWPEADDALRRPRRPRRRSARAIEATQALRTWRDGVGASPGRAGCPARLDATGYERVAEHVARLARFECSRQRRRAGGDRRRPRRRRGRARLRRGRPRGRAQARAPSAPHAARRRDRARRGQARQPGLRRARRRRRWSRPSATSSQRLQTGARRACMTSWDLGRAEEHLLSLELFGMRFGLERMRRLLTVLGSPQERFRAVHVVGTNGKSSTVRMTAALLEAHGVRTGSYLSPHLTTLRRADPDRRRRPRRPTRSAPRSSAPPRPRRRSTGRSTGGERVTQFELLTAAAFAELAAPRRRASRSSRRAWAGAGTPPTCSARAVVRAHQRGARAHPLARPDDPRHRRREARRRAVAGATLVLGEDAARGRARSRRATGARIVRAGAARRRAPRLPAPRTSRSAAAAAAGASSACRRRRGRRRSPRRCAGARAACRSSADDPLTISTARTTRPGIAALAAALPDAAASGRSSPCCRSSTTRTRRAMLRALLPRLRGAVFTALAATRARCRRPRWPRWPRSSAAPPAEIEPDPRARAWSARAELAGPGRRGPGHRLDLPGGRPAQRARARGGRARCERARPQRPGDDRARGDRRRRSSSSSSSASATRFGRAFL